MAGFRRLASGRSRVTSRARAPGSDYCALGAERSVKSTAGVDVASAVRSAVGDARCRVTGTGIGIELRFTPANDEAGGLRGAGIALACGGWATGGTG